MANLSPALCAVIRRNAYERGGQGAYRAAARHDVRPVNVGHIDGVDVDASDGVEFGAGNETRTRDPDLGKVVLYQLSYSRIHCKQGADFRSMRYEVKAMAHRLSSGHAARR